MGPCAPREGERPTGPSEQTLSGAQLRGGQAAARSISVAVSTCGDCVALVGCLEAVLACEHEPGEVIVVDNRPARSAVPAVLSEHFGDDARVRYAAEARVGLSHARNRGLAYARGDVVAFTDDDVEVDPGWLGALAKAFAPDVDCVTGLLLPLALETPAQAHFEQLAALGKGLERQSFTSLGAGSDPLFPYAAGRFGSGANTAVRRSVALALGGFDVTLGAGTSARGGEDLDLYVRLLLAGGQLVYEPAAIARHRHPASERGLRRRAFDYGAGLTAMLTKQLFVGAAASYLRAAVPAMAYLIDPGSRKNAQRGADYPRELVALEWLGMVAGPLLYAKSVAEGRSQAAGWANTAARWLGG